MLKASPSRRSDALGLLALLLPLGGCVVNHYVDGLRIEHAALSADERHVNLVVTLSDVRAEAHALRHHTAFTTTRLEARVLELPVQDADYPPRELRHRGLLLSGPVPPRHSPTYSAWQQHGLVVDGALSWCRFAPSGRCEALGSAPNPEPNQFTWLIGDEGRFVLAEDRLYDISQSGPLTEALGVRPGYQRYLKALRDSLGPNSLRSLVAGRWLLAHKRTIQPQDDIWLIGYDVQEDREFRVPRPTDSARPSLATVRRAAWRETGWLLWVEEKDCTPTHCERGRQVIHDLGLRQQVELPEVINAALRGSRPIWNPAQRQFIMVREMGREVQHGPERLRVEVLPY